MTNLSDIRFDISGKDVRISRVSLISQVSHAYPIRTFYCTVPFMRYLKTAMLAGILVRV